MYCTQGTHITVFTLGDHGGGDDDWREGPVVHTLEISTQPLASTGVLSLSVTLRMSVTYVLIWTRTKKKMIGAMMGEGLNQSFHSIL